jgi:hypothetical protein
VIALQIVVGLWNPSVFGLEKMVNGQSSLDVANAVI